MLDLTGMPAVLSSVAADRLVDVDVREDLRSGREPFARIMAARAALKPGEVMRVRAIFEPAPLYAVLGRQGLEHWTERLADDDWRVWFFESPAPVTEAPHAPLPEPEADTVVLDVRGMDPPEPLVHTMAALETLPDGATLVQVNVRVPKHLLARLDDAGFAYEVREEPDGLVRTFIRRR